MKLRRLSSLALPLSILCARGFAQSGPLQLISLTPPSGSGNGQKFGLTVADSHGGADVSQVGIYIAANFDGADATNACLAYYQRDTNRLFLAGNLGTDWSSGVLNEGEPLTNDRCGLSLRDSRVTFSGDRVTVQFAITFDESFRGSKLVYAYANSFGNSRNTGWKQVGSWTVTPDAAPAADPARAAVAAAAGVDPNDLATKQLFKPVTPYDKFMTANVGVTELKHQQGQLRFLTAGGRKVAVVGAVTHQDKQTGAWVPNAPVLSETNNGWRMDGTYNDLIIRKQGLDQHVITQTYTDFSSKHDSVLTLTVPNLVYDKNLTFHFVQDGLTWNLAADNGAAFDLSASVAKRAGPKKYTFAVSSSEPLSVNQNGDLVGDGNVILSRAVMIPKSGKRVQCSAWAYSSKDGASFVCDDSGFKDNQLPYRIDPSSQSLTDGGTYGANWECIDGDGCYSSSSDVHFNTANMLPAGAYSVSTSCGFDIVDSSFDGGDGVGCSADPLNNAGTTNVNIHMVSGDGPSACCSTGQSSADVTNVTLTVTWYNPVSVTVSPSAITVPAGQGCCYYNSALSASVDSPNTAATWTTSPASVGYFSNSYSGPNGVWYVPPAAVDGITTITAIATSVADPSKSGSASVTIVPGPLTVSVAPSSALLYAGQTRQFSATVTNRLTTGVNWSISPAIGTISASGLYTAPSPVPAQQAVTVTASSVLDSSKYATAVVQLARPMPAGLVAWWPADGNTLDVVSGVAAIGNPPYGSGKVNQAFMGAYNSTIQSNSPGSISGPRTLTAWVNPMANRGSHMSIVSGGGDDFGLSPQGSQYSLAMNAVTGAATVAPNVWTHVATTYDGSTIRLYINGNLVQSAAGTLTDYSLNTYQLGSGFYDALDEIQVYNRALSQAEIAQAMSPIAVTVSPTSGRIYGGQQATFTATLANTGVLTTGVTWSLGSGNPGSINAAGVYQAPSSVSSTQQIAIVATSVADPSRVGTASMTLSIPVAVSIAAPGAMWPSQIQQLTATVSNADNTAVTWAMASGPGAINAYGVYTTPYAVSGPTAATVRATSVADPTKSATATVTINPWGAGTPYQYFVSDPMTAANPALWGMNGSATVTAAGIVADGVLGGGSAISQAAIPDGTNDYEVRATVHLTNPITTWYQSYAVLARASANAVSGQNQQPLAGQGTFYAFTMANPWWYTGGCATTMYLSKMVNGSATVMSQFPFPCHDGMTMGMVVRDVPNLGTQITLSVDSAYTFTVTDNTSPITSGKPGVSLMPAAGTTISKVEIGTIDRVAPGVVSGGGVSAFPNRVELQWQAATDDNGGSGVVGYQISRGGVYLGTAGGTQYTDETGTAADRTAYTITAFDRHGNSGAGATLTAPAVGADARRIGVRPTGAYWGAAGEQIDLLSGNLNFALPLIKAQSRGGWSTTFMLSYNSQMWRQDSGGTWNLGKDVGYGLGWSLQAGSIVPVLLSSVVQYCVFTDATGAEYRLYPVGNGVFASLEGVHVWYDSVAQALRFPDGSWWDMYAQSAALEADAGTLYPTAMHDTNGNSITIQYQAGAGAVGANTSARIQVINDGRSGPFIPGAVPTYQFGYTAGAAPHLVSIDTPLGTSESYRFTIATGQSVSAPFGTGTWTTALLQSVVNYGLGTKHQLTYDGSGELTQVVTPLGGTLGWGYRPYLYTGTGRSYREVTTRQMTQASGGTQANWNVTPQDGATMHGSTTVSDLGANSSKVWTFGASGVSQGLATSYEERGPGSVALMHTDYTWTADAAGNVYVGTVVNTRNPGSSQVQSMSTQTLDTNGNLTQSAVYDYGNLSTPVKTYAYTYLADPNYTSRYILNRVAQVTMTPAVGSPVTLVTNTYDNYSTVCGGGMGMVSRTGSELHDDTNYGTGFTYRGNATQTVSVGGSASMLYESTGVMVCSQDGAGHTTGSAPSADTNYSLPGVLTPGGNSNLATTVAYTSSWAVTSVTGPNGANGTTTYDNFGRPQSTKIPDGAETDYTYAYAGLSGATANQQTAMLGTGTTARWKRTTLDGFGRVMRVESGNGPATNAAVSQVDTQYAPCACSPLGKVSQVSMPYAPGGTPVWTVYTYDGSGRTLTVTAPDGSMTRTEYLTVYGSYTGNLVRVTDAAGKWKIQQTDALGNLVRVIEPNPAGGADWITNYTYDALGHLTGVSMPRSEGTQTRTFAYTGTDLTSATNPENGTVTYQYDGSHHVTKRTDALGQETRYTYDAYGRLTEVQHWAVSYDPHTLTSYLQEQTAQRVDYYYDSNPLNGGYSQNAWGRLAAVTFQDENTGTPFSYMYSYNQAGRVTAQHMSYSSDLVHFDAAYGWDTEGRMTLINYGPQYQLTYDANGRLGGMSGSDLTLTASYGPAGEMLGLSYQGSYSVDHYNETRTYNPMLQLTRMTVVGTSFSTLYTSGTAMDMQYIYTAGQNNGRIVQSIDGAAAETVNYTYDALNRLATAGATSATWGQAFAYDGFGNLTGKTVTQGSAPTLSVSFDPMTNRQVGQSYDANGNPTGGSLSYDVENRMIAGPGGYYAYDPSGKRVKKLVGTEEFYFYGIGGQKLATMVCVGPDDGQGCGPTYNVYFGGKLVKSKGAVVATDRLGSVRASSTGDQMTYYPYGEERTSTADGREKFGTYTRDNVTQDYADQRYYAVGMGRFYSPDPEGHANQSEPQSFNQYAYVGGDPVNENDPQGLCSVMISGITMGPNASSPWSMEAGALGADTAYPYQGEGAVASIGSVIQQAVTTNDSTTTALNALGYALSTNSGLIDVIAYSGGAAAFTAAYGLLSTTEQARIGLVLYISPGAAGELANVQGTTSVLFGSGSTDNAATVGTTVPQGVPMFGSDCPHTDLTCLFNAAQTTLRAIASNGSCNSPQVFTRTAPYGVPGTGFPMPYGGGQSTPAGGYYFMPTIYYGPEGISVGPGGQWVYWAPGSLLSRQNKVQ